MHAEKVNDIAEATFDTTEDYELLFAALQHAKQQAGYRKRRVISRLMNQINQNGEKVPFLVADERLDLVYESIFNYAHKAYEIDKPVSQYEAKQMAYAFDVVDQIDVVKGN
jgi:hypothetical protein